MANLSFQKSVSNPFLFRLFLLKSLPMAFIAGIRVKAISQASVVTVIKFKWLTQNPFRSMYFACQAMAAEMSTGLLVMDAIHNSTPAISMLIVKNQAAYYKKAVGKITFACEDGQKVAEVISQAKQTGEGYVMDLKSIGKNEQGEVVSEFIFTWSVKAKNSSNS